MGEAAPETGRLPFIVTFGPPKPNGAARKLIRSHVMKGKNKGKSYKNRGSRKTYSETEQKPHVQASQGTVSSDSLVRCAAPSVPSRVGTDISLGFEPADAIEVSVLLPVFKFAAIAKQAMFSLEPHVLFDQATHSRYREYLGRDAAYLSALVYTVHLYFDLAAGRNIKAIQPFEPTYKHLTKSLSLIRERLAGSDDILRLSDSTILVILSLASHASMLGQYETASNHLKGIRQIVDLRGGMATFRKDPKLLIEMFRCDLGLVLRSGSQPVFFYDPVAEPFMPYLNGLSAFIPPFFLTSIPASMASEDMGISDLELARAWDTTATFCTLLNYASETNRRIPQETFLNTMASVMYRLLHLSYPYGTLEEMLRLGVLAFCSHMFLQWPRIHFPYQDLSAKYRPCLVQLAVPVAPQTVLWLLSTGAFALFGQEDEHWLHPWLRSTFGVCGIATWSDARTILKRHLWVDFLHDRFGLKMFETISQLPIEG